MEIKRYMPMVRKKILFVEDCQDNAFLVIEELELENPEEDIILMKDGQAAMDYLNDTDERKRDIIRSQVGLVLLDLNLPKIDGMKILKFLKNNSKYKTIPVVILTTSSDKKTIDEAYKNGANSFIIKSTLFEEEFVRNMELLKEFIKSVLVGGPEAGTENEVGFAVKREGPAKCREILEGNVKKAEKIVRLMSEMSSEGLTQFREKNVSVKII